MPGRERNIVIVGGGIIGCSTAYYLTRHPDYDPGIHSITLIEAASIAGGASGKAGGLLALWAYPSAIVPLSYRLHADLASEHNGTEVWGYRHVHSGQLNAKARSEVEEVGSDARRSSLEKRGGDPKSSPVQAKLPNDLDWVNDSVFHYQEIGDINKSDTAQVHPFMFTTCIAKLAQEAGAKVMIKTRVTAINHDRGSVTSVAYEDSNTGETKNLRATDIIVTAGPWTSQIYPKMPITAMRAHSITIRPSRPVSAHVLFTEIESVDGRSKQVSPEIYARPNNEVYACGEGDYTVPLPKTTADVEVDESYCSAIFRQVSSISDELRDGRVTAKQACYLPNVSGALAGPLIGRGDLDGLLFGAGHTCWGIQNGPGTGKVLSEFVFDGEAKSAPVATLDPRSVL